MSGGNAKRRRVVNSTALVYCEGAHDLAFLRHLINIYTQAGKTNTKFRSKQGKGGSADSLLNEVQNMPGAFDRKIVKTDRDRDANEIRKAEILASKLNVIVAWSNPCIEALLLSIIDGKNYSRYKSKTCKDLFERNHIPTNKRTDSRAYEKKYTIELLESAKNRLPELEIIIGFITS